MTPAATPTDPITTPTPFGRFVVPTDIRFGPGVVTELAGAIAPYGDRVLIVTDAGVRTTGLVDRILAPVTEAGASITIFDGVSPNPRDNECQAAAALARDEGITVIVAIGGGSPIDAAKCAAALATNGGTARDWAVPRRLAHDPLPLIAIPTTAGTGSEVTRGAVITDEEHRTKLTVKDDRMAPRLALVDPELTHSVPPHVSAATGIDVLTHAIEAYTGRRSNAISDGLALQAMRLVGAHLVDAVHDGSNAAAREGMMMASLLAGMAFGNADVAAVHCLAEALGGRYDTPHGVANAVMLPVVMRYNAGADPQRHANVADTLGVDIREYGPEEAARLAVTAVADLVRTVGIPALRDLSGIDPLDFPALALTAAANSSTPSNAREIDVAGYETLLLEAWSDSPAGATG
ncbi:MAG TPA: iron-containing alcohol dehydrogenase [Thermomicrobiales bacterium]|jgi:alcohol dehydrogenase|nr:iron-containing alcohol dehydrogenase [Thermomicrobiales bacterium]